MAAHIQDYTIFGKLCDKGALILKIVDIQSTDVGVSKSAKIGMIFKNFMIGLMRMVIKTI